MNIQERFQGFYKLSIERGDGTVEVIDWFPNLITNQGLDWIGNGTGGVTFQGVRFPYAYCAVGTGTTTPTFADTDLTSYLASTGNGGGDYPNPISDTLTYVSGANPYYSDITTFSFSLGAVVGNIAELGTGRSPISGHPCSLFSHSLIMVSGSPGTISLGSTDTLTVYYELRIYLNITDTSYSFVMNSVTYSGVWRLSNIATVPFFRQIPGSISSGLLLFSTMTAYNGTIGAITGAPSGASLTNNSGTAAAYTNGTYYQTITLNVPTGNLNLSGYISAFVFSTSVGQFQFSVSPVIPKDNLHTLSLTYNISWARY